MASRSPRSPRLLPASGVGPATILEPGPGHVTVVGHTAADQLAAAALLRDAVAWDEPLAIIADEAAAALDAPPAAPGLTFFSSGTTGSPRAHHRSWDTLRAEASLHGSADDRFLLTFNLARYAGLQVFLHCLRHGAAIVVPASLRDAASIVAAGAEHGATHLSVTPSLVKRLVQLDAPARLTELRQITLGGEHASQATLDLVRRCWPAARVTTIYASSEGGACFTASDGREGFPAVQLGRGRDGRRGELAEDGELIVHLADGRSIRTGDHFEQADGRILFRGRREDLINVGGYKVSPARVERVILGVAGVEECRVIGRPSPVLGEVVTAEIVGAVDMAAVRAACRAELARPEVPVTIRLVESLPLSAAQKLVRAEAA
jgi:acyl-coenzyme A synthetase/AMP-(fatty) acid ligase